MKSKISIWDCRRAIEIAGGIPLTIRGDLFTGPGPHAVARWLPEQAKELPMTAFGSESLDAFGITGRLGPEYANCSETARAGGGDGMLGPVVAPHSQ